MKSMFVLIVSTLVLYVIAYAMPPQTHPVYPERPKVDETTFKRECVKLDKVDTPFILKQKSREELRVPMVDLNAGVDVIEMQAEQMKGLRQETSALMQQARELRELIRE
jgi:predicted ATP-grasp superfamily ATP-dependent carboligase